MHGEPPQTNAALAVSPELNSRFLGQRMNPELWLKRWHLGQTDWQSPDVNLHLQEHWLRLGMGRGELVSNRLEGILTLQSLTASAGFAGNAGPRG
jgi:hypothetical protein